MFPPPSLKALSNNEHQPQLLSGGRTKPVSTRLYITMDMKNKWPDLVALIEEARREGSKDKFIQAIKFIEKTPESHSYFYNYLLSNNVVSRTELPGLINWKLPDFEIQFHLDHKIIKPALAFVRNNDKEHRRAIITAELTVRRSEKINKKLVVLLQREPVLVTSKGEILECSETSLAKLNLWARTIPFQSIDRWHSHDVRQFAQSMEIQRPQTPDLKLLFADIKKVFSSYAYYKEPRIYDLLSIYIIATYFYTLFQAFPLLVLFGPKQSGKSLTLQLIEFLAFNAMMLTDPTPAIIYRSIEELGPTLLLDEIESLASRRDYSGSIMSILRASYKPIDIPRMEEVKEGGFRLRLFSCYGPKVIATIQGVEDVLANRAIIINLIRRSPEDTHMYKRTDPALEGDKWRELRNRLYLLIMTRWEELDALIIPTIDELDGKLANRELELWTPMLSIANWIDRSNDDSKRALFNGLLEMALEKSRERQMQDKESNQTALVLQALLAIMKNKTEPEWVCNFQIKEQLEKFYAEPLNWVNETWVGRLMNRIGITKTSRRTYETEFNGEKRLTHYWIDPAWLQDYCQRYGVDLSEDEDE